MKKNGDASSDLPDIDHVSRLEGPSVEKLEGELIRDSAA
jgi:hypothetical protein